MVDFLPTIIIQSAVSRKGIDCDFDIFPHFSFQQQLAVMQKLNGRFTGKTLQLNSFGGLHGFSQYIDSLITSVILQIRLQSQPGRFIRIIHFSKFSSLLDLDLLQPL